MTVAELSREEFKTIISEVVEEKIRQLLDPDYGLELREDFVQRLKSSASSKEKISFNEVKKRLGFAWFHLSRFRQFWLHCTRQRNDCI